MISIVDDFPDIASRLNHLNELKRATPSWTVNHYVRWGPSDPDLRRVMGRSLITVNTDGRMSIRWEDADK